MSIAEPNKITWPSNGNPSRGKFTDYQQIPGLNTTNAPQSGGAGHPHKHMVRHTMGTPNEQLGGFAFLPAAAAVYAGLKTFQPFSKAKKILEENVGEQGKKSLWYKIPHRVVSVPASAGLGKKKRHRKRKAKK